MSKRLRWKRNPAETGLRRVAAPPRGWTLHDGETTYAKVYPSGGGMRVLEGWYWVARSPLPYINTCATPDSTPEEAKAAALAYAKKHLAAYRAGGEPQ